MVTAAQLEQIRLKVLKMKEMHQEVLLHNTRLQAEVEDLRLALAEQKNKAQAAEESNKLLKLAQPISQTSTEIEEKEKLLNQFISDIDQCIRLLSDQ